MSKKSTIWSLAIGVILVVAVVLLIVFVPANKSKSTNTKAKNSSSLTMSVSQKSAAAKSIEANFVTFFSKDTSMQERQDLLQNGSKFAQVMDSEFQQLGSENPSVTVSNVVLKSNSSAVVTYSVSLNGQTVLKDQTGGAVLVNKVWKVTDATLCQLFNLGGQTPQVCNNVH